MNGFVKDTSIGQTGDSVDISIVVNQDFGLTFNTNTHVTTDPLVFVNIGGVAETSPLFERECLIIHTSAEITFPYKTVFDIAGGNTTEYLTYGRLSSPALYINSPAINVVSTDALHVLDYTGSIVFGTYPPIVVHELIHGQEVSQNVHST